MVETSGTGARIGWIASSRRNPLDFEPRASDVEYHYASLAASPGRLKGVRAQTRVRQSMACSLGCGLTAFPPLRAMLYNPVRQRPLKTDIPPRFFRLYPLVSKDLFPF